MKTVLYVCGHNAARSQIAEALTNHLAREHNVAVRAESAGTAPSDRINSAAIEAVREIGLSMEGQYPKVMTQEMADRADRIITMGCGVDVAACPARIMSAEDWGLDDPAGQPIETVRRIRDEIRQRVEVLLEEMSGDSGSEAINERNR